MNIPGKLFVLLAGINRYSSKAVTPLRFAAADVTAFHAWLGRRTDLRPEHTLLLTQPTTGDAKSPTRKELLQSLHRLATEMTSRDTFLFYFAGHSLTTEDAGYLMPADADPTSLAALEKTAISLDDLRQCLFKLKARQQVLILDDARPRPTRLEHFGYCDFDGVLVRGVYGLSDDAADSPGLSRTIITSCWKEQVSLEYSQAGHGWFACNLLAHLKQYSGQSLNMSEFAEAVRERMCRGAVAEFPEAEAQTPRAEVEGLPICLRLVGDPQDEGAAIRRPGKNPGKKSTPKRGTFASVEPHGALVVHHKPAGALVRVMGNDYRANPARIELRCGTHWVHVMRQGSTDFERPVVLKPNTVAELRVGLKKKVTYVQAKWPMTGSEAAQVQQAAASELGVPVHHDLDLGNGVKLPLNLIPAGSFLMGSPPDEAGRDEMETRHPVRLVRPFYMGQYPVTQAQWDSLMAVNQSSRPGPDHPIVNVSLEEARLFCQKLRDATGWPACLPEEAEWEYACRVGTATPFSCGDTLGATPGNRRRKSQRSKPDTLPVGSSGPNAWGLYDLHGNVWERCVGRYGRYPESEVLDLDHGNIRWPPSRFWRAEGNVARGASHRMPAELRRSASRMEKTIEGWDGDLGFRVVVRLR